MYTPSNKTKVVRNSGSSTSASPTSVTTVKPASTVTSRETETQILDKIPLFPTFLVNRLSKDAQRMLNTGILEISKMSADKVEKGIEYLNTSRIFFDPQYDNEKERLTYLDKKIAFMNKQLEQLREQEGQQMIQKIVTEPIQKGKFDKQIKQIGPNYSIETCAWDIIQKLGGSIKKIPLSEFALRKHLEDYLREKYGKK